MSRIDEALKRAARAQDIPATSYEEAPEVHVGATNSFALDGYAIEGGAKTQAPLQDRRAVIITAQPIDQAPARPLLVPPALEKKLVVGRDIESVIVEQYRRLAAVLHDLQAKHGLKTLMVTSAAPQEGKTLTIANLALTLSESYHQRVLLVDADLRRPSLHEVFGIPNGTGLSDIVTGSGHTVNPVHLSPCLSVLTAGRRLASPLAMLTSERIRDVVVDAATQFDWVLLDTPPIGLLPDAQLVARLTDAALFVIAAGSTPYADVQRAIADLGPDRIVGTVLNRVEKRVLGSRESYGGYFYGAPLTEADTR